MTAPATKANFAGWGTSATADPTVATNLLPSSYTPTTNITVYALWSAEKLKYTVSFDVNGGTGTVAALTETVAEQGITLPAGPTRTGYNFSGWSEVKDTPPGLLANTNFKPKTATILYALWTGKSANITFDSNGGTGTVAAITDKKVGEKISLPAGTNLAKANFTFGGWSIVKDTAPTLAVGSDFNITAETHTLFAVWTANAGPTTFTVTFDKNGGTTDASPTTKTGGATGVGTLPTPPTKAGSTFKEWNTAANGSGTAFTASTAVTADITVYAIWQAGGGPSPQPTGLIERVTLSNACQVVYRFDIPSGKTWSDYEGVAASYMLETDDEFSVENSGRTMRLYGNYAMDFFQFNTTSEGNKYAYASLDGSTNNNEYILDDTGNGGWKSLSDALIGELGECPAGGEWFTINYKTDGTRANVKPHKHLPDAADTGPFIFGLGLPGQGSTNTIFINNVILKGKTAGTNDLLGQPLFISKDGYDYPAFSAYGTDGKNGENNLSRTVTQGTYPPSFPAVAPPTVTITFNPNKPTEADAGLTPTYTSPAGFSGTITLNKNTQQIGALPIAALGSGWLFGGWAETAAGRTPIATTMTFADDANLYAIWTYDAPELAPVNVTLNVAAITPTGNAAVVDADNGYKLTYEQVTTNSEYGNVHAWFTLDLNTLLGGTGKTITDVKAVTFDFTPIGGDLANKDITIIGSATQHTWKSDADIAAETITNAVSTGTPVANTAQAVTLIINQSAVNVAGPNYSIRIHTSKSGNLGGTAVPTEYSITNVKIIPFDKS